MEATVDAVGRVLIPKAMREKLGIGPGTKVDLSFYGAGITIIVGGRGGRVVEEDGHLVIAGEGVFTDEMMYQLIDEGRR